tara:strand:- start:796 stop:1155 length:360 start_codon:yes stop_codon:yes gene_type:complete
MKHLFIGLCLTLAFTSCQKEELEITEPEQIQCTNIIYQFDTEVELVDYNVAWPTNQCYPLLPTSSDYDYVYIVKPWYVPGANGQPEYVGDDLYYLFDDRLINDGEPYLVITVQSLIVKL